jgi:Mg-chelatase subunit ChlD
VTNVDTLIKNANAFVNSLDMVISQSGKSLFTFGDLKLHVNSENRVVNSLKELLPIEYGSLNRDGRLYTIVLDISHSMFMASKFTVAKQAAIRLISVLDNEDYVCLVTYSGDIHVQTPRKVKDCKDSLIQYIDSLTTEHGTDLGKGLEEALKKVEALNLAENQVMVISDGFSFDNDYVATEVAADLYSMGASVSVINTYVYSDGEDGKKALSNVAASGGGKVYEIMRPEDVDKIVLFGNMADDMVQAIVDQNSSVIISKYNDEVVDGIKSFDNILRYVVSIEKFDATTPIKIIYNKGDHKYTIPLYSYRSHGNGRVSCYTSNFASAWTGTSWSQGEKEKLISNILTASRPEQNIESPYSVYIDADSKDALIELIPSVLRSELDSSATLKITLPDGRVLNRNMQFDSPRFFYNFDTGLTGTYIIETTYKYEDKVFTETTSFDIAYLPEYDAFATFDKYSIYEFMRGNGSVVSDGIPSLEHNKNEITTYKQSFVIPLLIAAICIFVIDILVRKLRISKKKRQKQNNTPVTKGEKNG